MTKNNIATLLDEREMSGYELAKRIGYTTVTIYRLLNAPEIPPGTHYKTLKRIADVLEVKIDDLEIEVEGDTVAEANN